MINRTWIPDHLYKSLANTKGKKYLPTRNITLWGVDFMWRADILPVCCKASLVPSAVAVGILCMQMTTVLILPTCRASPLCLLNQALEPSKNICRATHLTMCGNSDWFLWRKNLQGYTVAHVLLPFFPNSSQVNLNNTRAMIHWSLTSAHLNFTAFPNVLFLMLVAVQFSHTFCPEYFWHCGFFAR